MASPFSFGIDFGTSTSEIAYLDGSNPVAVNDPIEKTPVIPSFVAINSRGEPVFGESARAYRGHSDGRFVEEIKRKMGTGEKTLLGGEEYRPEQIAALVLRNLRENAERELQHSVRDVVLSVPANFEDAAKVATKTAGELAGLNVVRLISEPTAAALAFGVKNLDIDGEQVVVFDFGGGTLDITVLEMMEGVIDVKCSFGDPHLGGKDFDEAMIQIIWSDFGKTHAGAALTDKIRRVLKEEAEKAKCALSSRQSHLVHIREIMADVDLDVEVTRAQFEHQSAPLLDRTRLCIKDALDTKKIRPSAIHRVLYVGGTTFIPAVRDVVAEMFGKEGDLGVDPQLAVCQGAAIQAGLIGGKMPEEQKAIILTDVAPKGLGVDVLEWRSGQLQLVYSSLIEPQTTLPYHVTKTYQLLTEEQESVEIKVYQVGKAGVIDLDQAEFAGEQTTITDIPRSFSGEPHPLDIDFSYDLSGLVQMKITIPGTDKKATIAVVASEKRMSAGQQKTARAEVDALWARNPAAKRYEALVKRAEELKKRLPDNLGDNLDYAINKLKDALSGGDKGAIKLAGDELADLLWDVDKSDR